MIDPVYEGKPMAGLVDLATNGEIPTGSTVLYAPSAARRPAGPERLRGIFDCPGGADRPGGVLTRRADRPAAY